MSSFCNQKELLKLGLGSIGSNVYISKYAQFYNASDIHIKSNVRIDDFCILSAGQGGISISEYVHIGCYSSLIGQGSISIAKFANISSRVSIFSSSDDFSGNSLTNPMIDKKYKSLITEPVIIEKHVIIGTNSTILPGVILEEGCAIGAHSLVKEPCSPFSIYAGVPVQQIGTRSKEILNIEKQIFVNE
jgi:acetyltransferase-like isoleucine patch superfamily enzyme